MRGSAPRSRWRHRSPVLGLMATVVRRPSKWCRRGEIGKRGDLACLWAPAPCIADAELICCEHLPGLSSVSLRRKSREAMACRLFLYSPIGFEGWNSRSAPAGSVLWEGRWEGIGKVTSLPLTSTTRSTPRGAMVPSSGSSDGRRDRATYCREVPWRSHQHEEEANVKPGAHPARVESVQHHQPVVRADLDGLGKPPVEAQGVDVHLTAAQRPAGQVDPGVSDGPLDQPPSSLIDRSGNPGRIERRGAVPVPFKARRASAVPALQRRNKPPRSASQRAPGPALNLIRKSYLAVIAVTLDRR